MAWYVSVSHPLLSRRVEMHIRKFFGTVSLLLFLVKDKTAARWQALAWVIGCLLVFFSAFSVAEAHYSTGIYIYGNSTCTQQKDPMNLTFYTNATSGNSVTHIQHHMNWFDTSGSTMYFWDHSQCVPSPSGDSQGMQRASGSVDRWHIRVRQGQDSDATWGVYSAAAAHYEVFIYCGHYSDNFDEARENIVSGFKAAHGDALYANNNNTGWVPQCNGGNTRSIDGKTAWISIP